jgi:hypothetical protein
LIAGAAGKDATDRVLPLAASVLRMQSRSTVARRLAVVLDRLVRVRKLVAFDDHVTDALDYPAVDPTDLVVFEPQDAADLGKRLRDLRCRSH